MQGLLDIVSSLDIMYQFVFKIERDRWNDHASDHEGMILIILKGYCFKKISARADGRQHCICPSGRKEF